MQPKNRYTYENAGFNSFMLRSLKSNAGAQNVAGGISVGNNNMAFDRQSVEGAIGDTLAIGKRLTLDGNKGRMIVRDTAGTTEEGWVGDLTE